MTLTTSSTATPTSSPPDRIPERASHPALTVAAGAGSARQYAPEPGHHRLEIPTHPATSFGPHQLRELLAGDGFRRERKRRQELSPAGFERLAQRVLREAGFVNVTVTETAHRRWS